MIVFCFFVSTDEIEFNEAVRKTPTKPRTYVSANSQVERALQLQEKQVALIEKQIALSETIVKQNAEILEKLNNKQN